ncbi:MAG: hypothetical protein H0X24_07295, partial [Ktedonobacterales bacterium]|nr:hypothetical protein [Ktedonobacterales bacterium]
PPTVRDEFVAQHIAVVKKPLNVDLLDVALVAAMQQVSDVPPFPTDATTASLA